MVYVPACRPDFHKPKDLRVQNQPRSASTQNQPQCRPPVTTTTTPAQSRPPTGRAPGSQSLRMPLGKRYLNLVGGLPLARLGFGQIRKSRQLLFQEPAEPY